MPVEDNYYQLLEIERTATEEEIKKAYKRMAFKYHPDHNRNKESEEKMKQLNKGYAVLYDPTKRKDYDKELEKNLFDIHFNPKVVSHRDYLKGLSYYNKIHDIYNKIPNDYDFKRFKTFKFNGKGKWDEVKKKYGDLYIKIEIFGYDKKNFVREKVKIDNSNDDKNKEEYKSTIGWIFKLLLGLAIFYLFISLLFA